MEERYQKPIVKKAEDDGTRQETIEVDPNKPLRRLPPREIEITNRRERLIRGGGAGREWRRSQERGGGKDANGVNGFGAGVYTKNRTED